MTAVCTPEISLALFARDGAWRCRYCGEPLIMWWQIEQHPDAWYYNPRLGWECGWSESSGIYIGEVDHVIPRSKGGTDDLSNLVLCCQTCNSTKRDRTPEWLREYHKRKPRIRWRVWAAMPGMESAA